MQSRARSRTRHSLADTRRPDCIPSLQQQQSSAEGSSPVRKQPRRQSLPARLSAPRAEEYNGAVKGSGVPLSSPSVFGSGAPARKIHGDVPGHLSQGQKSFYSCMMKICDVVSTQPLPMKVTSVTAHGDFFDRGDPVPRNATVVVKGIVDPLVQRLKLNKLVSAALAERAHRRNAQMDEFTKKALGPNGGGDIGAKYQAGSGGGGGDGGADDSDSGVEVEDSKRWWSQLCANKHLTKHAEFHRARDGEPLGSVADGVEWALLQVIRARNGHTGGACARTSLSSSSSSSSSSSPSSLSSSSSSSSPSSPSSSSSTSSRLKEDVDILVKVARQWAGCLTWSQASRGDWSYPGITTRLLKQDLHKPQIQVCVNMDTCAVAAGAGGTVGDVLGDAFAIDATSGWRLQPKHPSEGERPDYVGNVAAKRGDRRADFAKVTLWSPQSRSLNANLASVFGKEGIDEARRDSAALSAGRTELMARCYATLRVALQDLIEWKVPTCMLEGEKGSAVRASCLLWLKDTIARKVSATWAKREQAVSQVVACIKRSLEREAKVSDGVAVWLSRNFQELVVESKDEDGDEDGAGTGTVPGCLRPTLSTVFKGFRGGSGDGGATLTEKDFSALKRKEIKQAQEVDTVTAMLHHAFHLVLPHRPFKHKITWARFTRFFQQMGLRLHIARYHTEIVVTGRSCVDADSQGSFQPNAGACSSAQEVERCREQAFVPAISGSRGGGADGFRDTPNNGSYFQDLRDSDRSSPPQLQRRQVVCRLAKHMDDADFRRGMYDFPVERRGDRWVRLGQGWDGGAQWWDGGGDGGRWGGVPQNPAPYTMASRVASLVDVRLANRAVESGVAGGGVSTGKELGGEAVLALSLTEAAVANECLVSLLAARGTMASFATGPQVTAALRREGFPDEHDALALLKDVDALRGHGVRDRLWRGRRGAALVRVRAGDSLFARLPSELFRNVLVFLAS